MGGYLDFKTDRDELSERLGGGLPRGSLIVVEAPYGAGKSIFTQRVLFGLLGHGHTAGVVSTELTTLGFIEQMRSLRYDVDPFLIDQRLLFVPVYPLVAGRSRPVDLLRRLRAAGALFEKEVIIIDTFSKLLADQQRALAEGSMMVMASRHGGAVASPDAALQMEAEETLYHLKRLTATGKTILLTIEPGQTPDHLLRLFRDASDVHLALDFTLVGNTASRRIVVNRFSRAKNRFGDVIGYRVEPGVGLVIEIKSVA